MICETTRAIRMPSHRQLRARRLNFGVLFSESSDNESSNNKSFSSESSDSESSDGEPRRPVHVKRRNVAAESQH